MSEIVFILGAGASKSAGAPLMYDFLDRAEDLLDIPVAYEKDFTLVKEARRRLQVVHSKADLDLNNLESVLSAFDMAKLTRAAPGVKSEDIDRLTPAAGRVIAYTLERTISFDVGGKAPQDYRTFANAFEKLSTQKSCAIISFNYDLALDVALAQARLPPHYHLGEPLPPGKQSTLLKLHGSMNWVRCGTNITPYSADGMLREAGSWLPGGSSILQPGPQPWTTWITKQMDKSSPDSDWEFAIVAPSWSKGDQFSALKGPWKRAAQELSNATTIIFCGFSLPPADSYFRYLFALGTGGAGSDGNLLRQVVVIDPEPSVKGRFENLLGQDARGKLDFAQKGFDWLAANLAGIVDGKTKALLQGSPPATLSIRSL